jgi:hypothetical protein
MTRNNILAFVLTCISLAGFAQVDTAYIYNNTMPYGSLDIRIATSPTAYYYLQEGKTFSFREEAGARTGTFFDMTSSWDSSPYQQANLRFTNGSVDNFVMNYRFLVPQSYSASYQPGYPLLLILHGLGERANCWENKCYHADGSWNPITNTPPAPTDPALELLNNDHHLTNGGRAHLKAVNDAQGNYLTMLRLQQELFRALLSFHRISTDGLPVLHTMPFE